MSLAKKTITGIIWGFCEQVLRRGVSLITTLLLAYFLVPEDYGLLGMMAVFIAVAKSLMESGFLQALIRLEELYPVDLNTAFFANLALGSIAYMLLFFTAPLVAGFYDEVRLVELMRVAGLIVLINSAQTIQVAIFHRNMDFKAQFKAGLPASLLSSITAVILAYYGLGVWALIVQMLTAALITTIILWGMSEWRPQWNVSGKSLSDMYGFGYKLFLSGLLDTVFRNLYVVVIAKLFAVSVAGLYFFAEKIKELLLRQLVGAVQNATYPALASIQNDDARLKAAYKRIVSITTFVVFPVLMIFSALAQPLFEFLLPSKWWSAVPYLQLLCISGLFYPLHAINLNILKVKGRSDLFLYLEVVKKVITILIIFVSYRYGIIGILLGQIFSSVLNYIPNSYFSEKLIKYSVREQLLDFLPSLVLSLIVGGLIYGFTLLSKWSDFVQLLVLSILGVAIYFLSAHILNLKAYCITREVIITKIKFK